MLAQTRDFWTEVKRLKGTSKKKAMSIDGVQMVYVNYLGIRIAGLKKKIHIVRMNLTTVLQI